MLCIRLVQTLTLRLVSISCLGKISAQPHTTLCIQLLDRENNDKNNTLPLGKQICFTIAWGCAEILPLPVVNDQLSNNLVQSCYLITVLLHHSVMQ